jgi:hypothetical protein
MDKRALVASGILAFGVIGASTFVSSVAEAGEDEVVLGGHGAVWLGISEVLWLEGSGGAYVFFEDGGNHRALYEAAGGLVAAFDVLRTIPFAEATIGVVGSRGVLSPTLRAGVGADYLLSKHASIGVVGRYRPVGAQIASDGMLTLELRLGFRFEL